MANLRRITLMLVLICLLATVGGRPAGALAGRLDPVRREAAQTEPPKTDWQINQEIPESYSLVGENRDFQLYVDAERLAFKVVDRRSGYVWHSNLDTVGEDDKLNRTWTAFATSGISIDYLDQKAISKRASITNAERTIETKKIQQGLEARLRFTEPSIAMTIRLQLEENGVNVEIPFESIAQENPDFKLGMVHAYPFMGATKADSVPGYMFIPDGTGSIIRFAETTKAQNMYYGRYYGADLGMITGLAWEPTIRRPLKISVPVFGMVHGDKQHGFLAIVEKGASYGEIQAHPAGVITQFNFLYNAFLYNESFFQATNKSGAGVTTLQQETNAFDIQIHYRFLTGEVSDYVGMARSYQAYLVERGDLQKVIDNSLEIGIRLEFLGGEKEKVLLWERFIPMTTIAQAGEILNELDVKNPAVVFYGWQPLGASSMPPERLKIEPGLGTTEEMAALREQILADDGSFFLYLDPQAALRDEKGYSERYDLAMSITNFNLYGFNRSKVNYYLNYDALSRRYRSLSGDVFEQLKAGLALDSLGSTLYSDFKRGNFLNREQAIASYQEMLAESEGSLAFYLPNDYLFGFMEAYFDIPLTNNGYIYTSEAVPFIQIVLSGYVPYYGTALNFSSDTQEDLLRHVDFGVYPSYFLSFEPTGRILKTPSSWIFTSSYNQWGREIEETYQWLNSLLGPVKGQSIIGRENLATGIVATTYANGKQIIVNYTEQPYTAGNITVNGRNAAVKEVTP